jgi:CHC2 zinc finger
MQVPKHDRVETVGPDGGLKLTVPSAVAANNGRPVAAKVKIVARSETQAKILREMGIRAVAGPSEPAAGVGDLVGLDGVWIIEELDDLAWGRSLAACLIDSGKRIHLVNLGKGLGSWIKDGGDREAMRGIVKRIPPLTARDVAGWQKPLSPAPTATMRSEPIPASSGVKPKAVTDWRKPPVPNLDKATCEQIARGVLGEPIKRVGAELLWRCPNHDDHHPSLSVNPKKDVFMCGPCCAGGTAWQLAAFLSGHEPSDKDAIKAWLDGHGLSNGTGKRKVKADGKRGPVVAIFTHKDMNGNPVCRKRRHEPGACGKDKDYTWERFEAGKWVDGLGDDPKVVPPLYRLPLIKNEPLVFLFESHPDTALAATLGLPATTSGGAKSWLEEYAEILTGKSICLVPDNDKSGARYEAAVCASLYGKAASPKVVHIAPQKDFTRWIEAGGTKEKLLNLYRETPEWKPAGGAEILDAAMQFARRFVSLTEAQARAVALWVVHTHAFSAADCTPYLSINSAEKQSGKTRLLEVLELLVGKPWLTGGTTKAALVRKIEAEDAIQLA